MLTYLLRKDLVVQLHTYILIMVPEYIKIGCSVEEYEHLMIEENSGALTPTMESPTVTGGGGAGSGPHWGGWGGGGAAGGASRGAPGRGGAGGARAAAET